MNKENDSIIWIRHMEKLYNNGKATEEGQYQHDPEIIINKTTLLNVDTLISELLNKYGKPKKFIVSPFLRTRQTSDILLGILNSKYDIYPKVEYSTDISEYLGFCRKQYVKEKADLEPKTRELFKFNVYLGESFNHFKKRLENHIYNIENENQNVWVITHGIVLSSIYTYLSKKIPKDRPEPLDYISLYKNEVIKSF
jgi:broad specificity phosphatase PhoE